MRKKGFTLFEVLLVISIFLLVLSIGFLGVSRYYDYYTFAGEVNELVDDLHYAKQMSVAQQINHGIVFDYEDNRYFLTRDENGEDYVIKEKIFSPNINLSSDENYPEARFTLFGAVFRSGLVIVESEQQKRIINIKPSGFIHVKRSDVN